MNSPRIFLLSLCLALPSALHAQTATFTYQGFLLHNNGPANGAYEMSFTLFDAATNGNVVGASITIAPLAVSNGLFTARLDFGATSFPGANRWLEVAATVFGSDQPVTTLVPRQPVTSSPYAIRAVTASTAASAASVTGPIPDSLLSSNIARLSGSVTFGGTVTAPRIGVGTNVSGAALQIAGGTNVFSASELPLLGVITNSPALGVSNMIAPINVFVSGTRAYVTSYQPGALYIFDVSNPRQPQILGAAFDNGGQPSSPFTRLGGADGIFVTNNIAYVTAENDNALTIINVSDPRNLVKLAEVVDGINGFNGLNLPTGVLVSGTNCFVLGFLDSALSILDISNPANPRLIREIYDDSAIPGSPFTKMKWPYQMTLVGNRLYVACRGDSAITILDVSNPANPMLLGEAVDVTVNPSSPFGRLANANWVDVVGNVAYVASGAFSTTYGALTLIDVSNPASPRKLAELSDNALQPGSPFTRLAGAWAVKVSRQTAFVTCFGENALTAIDVRDPQNPKLLRELVDGVGGYNHLSFTEGLTVAGDTLYVVGDGDNGVNLLDLRDQLGLVVEQSVGIGTATPRSTLDVAGVVMAKGLNVEGSILADGNGEFANVAARGNVTVDTAAANAGALLPGLVFGGDNSEGIASRRTAGIGSKGLDFYTGGQQRVHIATNGNIGLGTITPNHRLGISGGPFWTANAWNGAVELDDAAAIGWRANAAGQRFGIGHSGGGFYFFRTASDPGTVGSAANYDLFINDSGNVGVGTLAPLQRLHVLGNILASGTITPNSDRNAKTDIRPVDPAVVLERVTQLPIQQWRFRSEGSDVKHVGPMAQDFYAAFGLGEMPTAIATVDADGVALAAIQGLNTKLTEELKRRDAEIAELRQQLSEIKSTLRQVVGQRADRR
jgi:hypothetical protein